MPLDVATIRQDFPIFRRTVRDGKKLIYLDSGATSQKPEAVIQAEGDFYRLHNAAVHRGAHQLAEEATDAYEGARSKVANFIGAQAEEIVFTKSATESINLIAYAMSNAPTGSRFALTSKDRIVVTEMEHHANLIPWQQLASRSGAKLSWFEVLPDGRLDLNSINSVISADTKVVAITHQSNVLGTVNPLEAIVARAREVGAVVVLDACQSVPHMPIDVKKLGVDFLVFSGHKALGPTGIGVLWSNQLDDLPPFLFGGSMIENVTMESATWAPAPKRFEAGVPNMAQAVGLGAALDYLNAIGMENVFEHEMQLTKYFLEELQKVPTLKIVGPLDLENRGSCISFTVGEIHPHDLGQYLDSQGIAVRTGHHCAWPLTRKLGVPATTRASLYLYNQESECDLLVKAIVDAQRYFA
ncbi:MAG: SufS family cysteine desulfurase [Actinobacteria bacterium]|jgi:cysteine desulfurase / selenocysteine lyase|uniref:cysteine desulfurase n=1 Tax=freshwater metagenome TaxID=449393 RepID=A0A6J6DMC8_9ZZZZ|nr:SufS family cysteine desulfurase [Actinomycetota bacterium]